MRNHFLVFCLNYPAFRRASMTSKEKQARKLITQIFMTETGLPKKDIEILIKKWEDEKLIKFEPNGNFQHREVF